MPTQPVAPGITRFDIDERHGYMVRIRRDGNQINEYFSDKKLGGKKKSLAAAKERYAQLYEELGPVESATKNLLTRRNTTGKVGVHIAHSYETRWANNEYFAYCASWKEAGGARKKINFSWNLYGKKQAFELACIAREKELTDRGKVVAIWEKLKLKAKTAKSAAPKAKVKVTKAKPAKAKPAKAKVTKAKPAKAKPVAAKSSKTAESKVKPAKAKPRKAKAAVKAKAVRKSR